MTRPVLDPNMPHAPVAQLQMHSAVVLRQLCCAQLCCVLLCSTQIQHAGMLGKVFLEIQQTGGCHSP